MSPILFLLFINLAIVFGSGATEKDTHSISHGRGSSRKLLEWDEDSWCMKCKVDNLFVCVHDDKRQIRYFNNEISGATLSNPKSDCPYPKFIAYNRRRCCQCRRPICANGGVYAGAKYEPYGTNNEYVHYPNCDVNKHAPRYNLPKCSQIPSLKTKCPLTSAANACQRPSFLDRRLSAPNAMGSTISASITAAIGGGAGYWLATASKSGLIMSGIGSTFAVASSFWGLFHPSGQSPEDIYNLVMQDMDKLRNNILRCVDLKFKDWAVADLLSDLRPLRQNLKPSEVKKTLSASAQHRITHVWNMNYMRCNDIAKNFFSVQFVSSYGYETLDYAMEVLELCQLNFIATVVDMASINKPVSEVYTIQRDYSDFSNLVMAAIFRGMTHLENMKNDRNKCGTYNSFKTLAQQKIDYLWTNLYTPAIGIANSLTQVKRNYVLKGCRKDSSNRVLPYAQIVLSSMTITKCGDHCKAKGYKYFGVEYGRHCFCGRNLPSTKAYNCYMSCAGDGTELCGGGWAIDVYEIVASELWKCDLNTNLALNRPATQTSTAHGGVASRATDGNSNGIWNGGSCTHTGMATGNWLYVDLGSSKSVCAVELTNRQDCCSDRLARFDIFVTNRRPSGLGWEPTVAERCVYSGEQPSQATTKFGCWKKLSGRYVGVKLRTRNYLTLCEVKVFGGLSGSAVGAVAEQGATANQKQSGSGSTSSSESNKPIDVGLAVGLSVGVCLLLVACVVGAAYCKRMKMKRASVQAGETPYQALLDGDGEVKTVA